MSGRSFTSIYLSTPQLDQLNDDLRAAETDREAPRLSVSKHQVKAISGEAWRVGGKLYRLVDRRNSRSEVLAEETLFDGSLGTFRLQSGGLGFFVPLRSRLFALSTHGNNEADS